MTDKRLLLIPSAVSSHTAMEALSLERWDRMNEKTEGMGSAVVLEEGAEYPKWIAEYQRRAPNCVVIAHRTGESMEALVTRVTHRIAGLNGELCVGVVACALTADEPHLRLREELCRVLLEALSPGGGGEVVLAANWSASDASKFAVFQLAGTLCESLRGTNRVVRVRFSSGRSESVVVPKLPPSDPDDRSEVRLVLPGLSSERARRSG